MNGRRLTDAQIGEALRAHLPERADVALRERILDSAETTGQQRALPSIIGALSDADPIVRRRSLLVAAALLVALAFASAAAVGSWRLLQRDPIQDLRPNPPAYVTTPSLTPAPSSTAVAISPSPTTAALTWTQASLKEDWPAPVRTEPAGAPAVVPILLKTVVTGTNCPGDCSYSTTGGRLGDPTGDTGSADNPWADITEVTFCGSACLTIDLVADAPRGVDPSQQWIAYGVVADTDGDGVPDWRYGTDNIRVTVDYADVRAADAWRPRVWRTDLHTGRTETAGNDRVWLPSGTMFYGGPDRLHFGGDTTAGLVGSVPKRFYVWASVIQDGRVVATDYAPDAGWLVPSPNAKP